VDTAGTIYPGLIELHNHLAYNVLPMWRVQRQFTNNHEWPRSSEYSEFIAIQRKLTQQLPAEVLRYAEAKCMVAGVTTTQGAPPTSRRVPTVLRQAELSRDPDLPPARSRIATIPESEVGELLESLQREQCVLVHIAEGTDAAARDEFLRLHLSRRTWALAPSFAGVHCTALMPEDFDELARHGASVVWSPVHDLTLYGKTLDIKAAHAAGVQLGIGPSCGQQEPLVGAQVGSRCRQHIGSTAQ
jgi:cytosine/adenosine deaminase-related metal-dependent hydrolase